MNVWRVYREMHLFLYGNLSALDRSALINETYEDNLSFLAPAEMLQSSQGALLQQYMTCTMLTYTPATSLKEQFFITACTGILHSHVKFPQLTSSACMISPS